MREVNHALTRYALTILVMKTSCGILCKFIVNQS